MVIYIFEVAEDWFHGCQQGTTISVPNVSSSVPRCQMLPVRTYSYGPDTIASIIRAVSFFGS